MIISHKHRFFFVKTRKTVGTSLEIALSKICGQDDVITPISKVDEIARKQYAEITAQNYFIPLRKYTQSQYIECLAKGGF